VLTALGAPALCLSAAGCSDGCRGSDACSTSATTAQVGGIWTIEGEGERAGCAELKLNGPFKLGPSASLLVDLVKEEIDAGPLEARVPFEAGTSAEAGAAEAGPRDAGAAESGRREASGPRELGPPDAGPDAPGLDRSAGADLLARDGRGEGIPDARPDRRRDSRQPRSYRYRLRLRNPPGGFSLQGEVQGTCVSFETEETDLLGAVLYQFKGKAATSGRTVEGRFTGVGPSGCAASGTFEVEVR
jgi:hypothetical protein